MDEQSLTWNLVARTRPVVSGTGAAWEAPPFPDPWMPILPFKLVDRRPCVTPVKHHRSIAYRADRRPDPTPIHKQRHRPVPCNNATPASLHRQ